MNDQELSVLFEKLIKNECSEEEADLILALIADEDYDSDLKALIIKQLNQQSTESPDDQISDSAQKSLDAGLTAILNSDVSKNEPSRGLWLKKRVWYAVAASVLLFSIVFYHFTENPFKTKQIASTKTHLIVPGSNKAILTLSNGVKINLADASEGDIAKQASATIKKTKSGVLVYQDETKQEAGNQQNAEPLFNTITTPKGGQYEVILPDGSKVWLNAASSLKYPAKFSQQERLVELSGEGYFEIATVTQLSVTKGKEEKRKVPFIVKSGHQKIEVLGTQFNVNAYTDESSVKTTLLKGSVRVSVLNNRVKSAQTAPAMLRPGQQAELYDDDLNIKEVNAESAAAWKNGSFQFEDEDIRAVMRKIARWYNVDVDYRGNMEGKLFSGTISKYKDVNEVLKMLQLTGSVSFTIKNRTITVS